MNSNNSRRKFLQTTGIGLLTAPVAISLANCSPAKSTAGNTSTPVNMPVHSTGIVLNVSVTGFTGPLLGINNVSGSGLENAVTIDAPKVADMIVAPANPYKLY